MSFAQPLSLPGHYGSGGGPRPPADITPHVVWAALSALAAALATWWIGWRAIPILSSLLGIVVIALLVRHPELSATTSERPRPAAPHVPQIRLFSASWAEPKDPAPRQAPVLRVVARPAAAPRP